MPNGPDRQKHPSHVVGAAIMVGKIATGQVEDDPTPAEMAR